MIYSDQMWRIIKSTFFFSLMIYVQINEIYQVLGKYQIANATIKLFFKNIFYFQVLIVVVRLAEWVETMPMNQASLGSSPAHCKYLTDYNLIHSPIYTHFHIHPNIFIAMRTVSNGHLCYLPKANKKIKTKYCL